MMRSRKFGATGTSGSIKGSATNQNAASAVNRLNNEFAASEPTALNYLNLASTFNNQNQNESIQIQPNIMPTGAAMFPFPSANQAAAKPSSSRILSLREWTKHAINCVGDNNGKQAASSPAYMQAALTIANCLADQIIQAEQLADRYGISTKLDLLPISVGQDWASYVMVRLKGDNSGGTDQKIHAKTHQGTEVEEEDVWGSLDYSGGVSRSIHVPLEPEANQGEYDVNAQPASFLDLFKKQAAAEERSQKDSASFASLTRESITEIAEVEAAKARHINHQLKSFLLDLQRNQVAGPSNTEDEVQEQIIAPDSRNTFAAAVEDIGGDTDERFESFLQDFDANESELEPNQFASAAESTHDVHKQFESCLGMFDADDLDRKVAAKQTDNGCLHEGSGNDCILPYESFPGTFDAYYLDRKVAAKQTDNGCLHEGSGDICIQPYESFPGTLDDFDFDRKVAAKQTDNGCLHEGSGDDCIQPYGSFPGTFDADYLDRKVAAKQTDNGCLHKEADNNCTYIGIDNNCIQLGSDSGCPHERDGNGYCTRIDLDNGCIQQGDDSGLRQGSKAEYKCLGQAALTAINYLEVDSAEIKCPEGENSHDDQHREKSARIFYLGLVLYELFSGGDQPSATLYALPLFNGAFFSLSILTMVNESNKDQTSEGDSNRRQRASQSKKEMSLCEVACEYLRILGINGPLCQLIFNMLDCVYGDLGGKECFTKMEDVKFDLQLMQDKPFKFLQSLDLDQLSRTGLPLDEAVIPREAELESINACYQRCASGICELAIIKGISGSGKTWLAQQVGHNAAAKGGVFLTGKFDQMQQTKPFALLASAFNQYCDMLTVQSESNWAMTVTNELKTVLGQDVLHLVKVIPRLGLVLNVTTCNNDSFEVQNHGNAIKRLHHLLCLFVEVICTNTFMPVTLFMDDVQWIDQASVAVLDCLLRRKQQKFFFLGCCRDDEMNADHIVLKMLDNVRASGVNVTTVKLSGMSENVLNEVTSNLLCLSPRVVKPLADIAYNKTRGNALFFYQLLLSLYHDGLLYLDFDRHRWMWDEEKILSTNLPDNIAICLTNCINKLRIEVQVALHNLSMFGASAKAEYIEYLQDEFNLTLIDPLKEAEAEGLVRCMNGMFSFCHDRIQSASYDLVGERDRRCNHLAYGKGLIKKSMDDGDDELLYVAVNQLNLAGRTAVTEESELLDMAMFNVAAGKRSISMSEFSSAATFFDNALGFLSNNHWSENYEFSLQLYELACKSALATGNLIAVGIFFTSILEHARSFDDTLNVQLLNISLLAHSSKIAEALELGRDIVAKLGEALPINTSQNELDQQIQHTQSLLRGLDFSESNIHTYLVMTDERKIIALKFLAQLQVITWLVNSPLHPFVILKMIQTTIVYGLSPSSPIAFACFGSYLAKLGSLQVGYRFALMGKSLLSKLDAKDSAGEVIALVTELQCFMEPARAANELRIQGKSAACTVGDMNWACLNQVRYCEECLWVGMHLSSVDDVFAKAQLFFKQQDHKLCLAFNLVGKRFVRVLLGEESGTMTLSNIPRSINDIPRPRLKMLLSFYSLCHSFLLNQRDLKSCSESFLETDLKSCFLVSNSICHVFIAGLAAFRLYRDTGDSLWMERGCIHKQEIKHWADLGAKWNLQQKLQLIEAEEAYCRCNYSHAKQLYKAAIQAAKSHRYINDEALSYELAARFYLETSDMTSSLEHFRLAHEKYCEWGAVRKAQELFVYIHQKLGTNV